MPKAATRRVSITPGRTLTFTMADQFELGFNEEHQLFKLVGTVRMETSGHQFPIEVVFRSTVGMALMETLRQYQEEYGIPLPPDLQVETTRLQ